MKNGLGLLFLRARIGRAWWLPVLFLLATTAAVKAGDFTYTTNSYNTITITKYTGSGSAVVIPSTIDSKSVTSIGNWAFTWCTSLTGVTIPDGVISIGDYAFESCSSLTSVTIGNGVTRIGRDAFCCTRLNSVTIGNGVTRIGRDAFRTCTSLTSAYFRGNAPSVGSGVFAGDNKVTVYYLAGTTGWGPTFCGRPTAVWKP